MNCKLTLRGRVLREKPVGAELDPIQGHVSPVRTFPALPTALRKSLHFVARVLQCYISTFEQK
jgi:hypothetical protein